MACGATRQAAACWCRRQRGAVLSWRCVVGVQDYGLNEMVQLWGVARLVRSTVTSSAWWTSVPTARCATDKLTVCFSRSSERASFFFDWWRLASPLLLWHLVRFDVGDVFRITSDGGPMMFT